MKKRLIAILLAVCTIAAMLSGLCITASASNDISGDKLTGYVIGYTLAKGDTVSNVCKKLGIDFQANQAAITKINNIADYTKLAVGRVVWLPATEVGKAENYYTLKSHTLVAGDSLDTLCSRYGITTGDVLLNRLNTNLTNLTVGQTLTFPAYTGSGNGLGTNGTTVAGGAIINTGTGTGTGTGSVISAPTIGADSIAYYLIPYTMQTGDTVAQVCANLGISFNANQGLITRVNNITNYTRVAAGRTILLPSNTPNGGTCYAVYAHKVIQGEYVLQLCNNFGISYNNTQALLKALNNSSNLNNLLAGSVFYLPISGTYGAGGTGIGGGIGGGTGTGTGTANTQAYAITSAATSNGSFLVKVGGAVATSAMEGETVTVAVTGNTGYVETEINVFMTGSSSTTVAVSNNTFVMPAFPVTVKVTFSKATLRTITCNPVVPTGQGTYTLKENGSLITGGQAYSGSEMTVTVSPVKGYVLDEIIVEKDGESYVRTPVYDNKFIMPNYNIKISVYLKRGNDYGYKLNGQVDGGNGTFDIKVGDSISDRAKTGAKVTIVPHPNKGYKFSYAEISYNDKNNYLQTKKVTNKTFTMPEVYNEASEVTVTVKFVIDASYAITLKNTKINGQSIALTAKNERDDVITSSAPGELVFITSKSKEYEVQSITVFNNKTKTYLCQNQGNPSFTMPEGGVTVTAVLQKLTPKMLTVKTSSGIGDTRVRIIAEGSSNDITSSLPGPVDVVKVYHGSTVTFVSTPGAGCELIGAEISYQYAGKAFAKKVSGTSFTMPSSDAAVTLTLDYKTTNNNVTVDSVVGAKHGTDPSNVLITVNNTKAAYGSQAAAEGDTVAIKVEPEAGDKVKNVYITFTDSENGKQTRVDYNKPSFSFTMPDGPVSVTVVLNEESFNISKVNPDSSIGSFTVKAGDTEVGMATVGATLRVDPKPAKGYIVSEVYYTKADGTGKTAVTTADWSFNMQGYDIKVYVEFKPSDYYITVLTTDDNTGRVTASNGTISVTCDDSSGATLDFQCGDVITVSTVPETGMVLDSIKVYGTSDPSIIITMNDNQFVMPEYEVTIEATFRKVKEDLIVRLCNKLPDYDATIPEGCDVVLKHNGVALVETALKGEFEADEGWTVEVGTTLTGGHGVTSIEVYAIMGDTPIPVSGNTFKMPGCGVYIIVNFS